MNLLELSKLLLDEKLAEEYLLEKGILKTFTSCEKCGSTKLGRIRRQRYKCYGCKAEWGIRKGSILHAQSISSSKFIGLVKCFELELSAKESSIQLSVMHNTAKQFYTLFRTSLTGKENFQKTKSDTIIKDGTPNFSISIKNKQVEIKIGEYISGANLFSLKRTRVPNKEVAYIFDYQNIKPKKIEKCLNHLSVEQNHFWRFAKEKLLNYRGTSLEFLYLYLKEIEFRYNHKNDQNFYHEIMAKIAEF